jgi:tetratricopeptide (TPR) repeat protein
LKALGQRVTPALAALVFLGSAFVFLTTLTPTVPFWDSGEFIAVSKILGIPHPPGTPLYVLLGRLVSMVPWATVAQRLNGFSAVSSALAVMLTYLTALRLIRLAQGRAQGGEDVAAPSAGEKPTWFDAETLAQIGAVTAALLLAFSDNFWENAIEAEVYSMMSLAQILVFWLGLKWWDAHEKKPSVAPLLLCVYVMWLCVGLHLGVGMMGLPLIVLVGLVDRPVAVMLAMPILSVLGVTFGLERMVGIVLILSIITTGIYVFERKLPSWMLAVSVVGGIIGAIPAFGDTNFDLRTGLVTAIAIGAPLAMLGWKHREGRIIALALGLMVVGYSTHVYLPIRAAQHPAINEGNPSDWDSLRFLLERKQYGESSMFTRRGPWSAQLDKEFWRYWKRQWTLMPTPQWNGPGAQRREPSVLNSLLPLLLGLLGGWYQRRNRISWLTTGTLLLFGTVGMILFLNFTDHEVRDRDYFFTTGYHTYTLWIGLGVAWLIGWVRDSFTERSLRTAVTAAVGALMLLQPFLVMRTLWFTHDRRGNYVAHDYAYNMLVALAPNSFVFTNGDNDTFPLWYMQQVENFRRDVRVVNLSLLNTDWYIKQLRDEAPKVPIDLDDRTVKMLGIGAIQDSAGRVIMTNAFMTDHIMHEDRTPTGWKIQPYFAVTVPEHFGYDRQFSLEGLVYRVNPDTLHNEIDVQATSHNLYDVFKYRGLFLADGAWDTTVYKDENASTLSRNYAAAHLQLAFYYRGQGKLQLAIAEMERVSRMFPDYTEILAPLGGFYMDAGDTDRALALFRRLAVRDPGNPEAHYYLGWTLMSQGHPAEALPHFDAAIQIDPNYNRPYYAAYYALKQLGQDQRAAGYLSKWVDLHPDDAAARQLLDSESQPPGGKRQRPAPPRPPTNTLP